MCYHRQRCETALPAVFTNEAGATGRFYERGCFVKMRVQPKLPIQSFHAHRNNAATPGRATLDPSAER